MQQIEEIRQQLLAFVKFLLFGIDVASHVRFIVRYLADSGFIQADRNLLNSLSR